MKRSKRLYAMLGILVVACIATFAVTQTKEEREQIKATGEIVLQVSSDDVQSLSWEYGETSLAFHKDETWLYDEDEAFPVDENTIYEMLEQFESFGVSFVIEQVTDYSMYGLDDPVCTIHFATEDQSYVRIGESQIVYKVSEYNSNRLRAVSYNELRHREVLPADFEDIYQIDVTLEGSDYTIAVDGEKDDERIWKYQEDEVAIDALQDALETLDAEYSSDFLSDDPTGKEEIRLTVHLDNENHPKVDIELYRHDGEDCLAVVDGETFALVPRSDVVDLIEAVNAIVLN